MTPSSELRTFARYANDENLVGYRPNDVFYVDGVRYDPHSTAARSYAASTPMIDLKDDGCICLDDDNCRFVGTAHSLHMGPRPDWSREDDVDTIV